MSLLISTRGAHGIGTVFVGAALLMGSMSLGSPADAQAAELQCGAPTEQKAETSTRISRVRSFGCFERSGNSIRPVGFTHIDKPFDCTYGRHPTQCPHFYKIENADFEEVKTEFEFGGRVYTCDWGALGPFDRKLYCQGPWVSPGRYEIRSRTGFNVNDDGKDMLYTDFAGFTSPF